MFYGKNMWPYITVLLMKTIFKFILCKKKRLRKNIYTYVQTKLVYLGNS